jgi:exosortase B
MPSAVDDRSRLARARLEWLPVVLGLLALYVPVFYELGTTIWQTDEHAHAPIILAVVIWLTWRKRKVMLSPLPQAPSTGMPILIFGLLVYVLGKSQDITIFEVGALVPILLGTLVALRGWQAVNLMWFPLAFIVFMIPLPSVFVDALTGPLKQHVSNIAESLLYNLGYPVGRTGVMLTIGQYQLLVADACSGLNSMFSLTALGLLYLYLLRRKSWLHNGLIIASILPTAFAANIVRVLVLVLVTYYFGDAAGQGFLHGAAGMVLVMVALLTLLGLDAALARFINTGARY